MALPCLIGAYAALSGTNRSDREPTLDSCPRIFAIDAVRVAHHILRVLRQASVPFSGASKPLLADARCP